MTIPNSALTHLSNDDLLNEVKRLAQDERNVTARLIASLAELDARRLYLGEGCSSLFTYCTHILHLSEHAAYGRIEAARAARRFRSILELLAEGAITLTTVTLLAPHLTPENTRKVLESARHKSKREVEQIVAGLNPRPAVPATIRKLPEPKTPGSVMAETSADASTPGANQQDASPLPGALEMPQPPARRAEVKPLAPERFKIQFTMDRATYDKLLQVQDLLRHQIPDGDPAAIFDKALTRLLEELQRTKLAATDRPRTARAITGESRHIPALVKRAVWKRDGRRCAFVGTNGRCCETGFLEFHHVVPFALGGESTCENIELRCRSHNRHEAEQCFGPPMLWEQRWTEG
jgi:5-methylcytosine-specific restriction endonuclease McrA